MTSLQEKDGIWSEADHASLMRYGEDGRLAARSLNEARGACSTNPATLESPVVWSSGTVAA